MSTDLISEPATLAERLGRYTYAELAAMVGKRGRKPPEFYERYPEAKQRVSELRAAQAARPRKVQVDDDALAAQVRAASPAVRRLISDLLAVVGASGVATVVEPAVNASVIISEPIYADPELLDTAAAG